MSSPRRSASTSRVTYVHRRDVLRERGRRADRRAAGIADTRGDWGDHLPAPVEDLHGGGRVDIPVSHRSVPDLFGNVPSSHRLATSTSTARAASLVDAPRSWRGSPRSAGDRVVRVAMRVGGDPTGRRTQRRAGCHGRSRGRAMTGRRAAQPGERCTCGRQAVAAFDVTTDRSSVVCGLPDGGDQPLPVLRRRTTPQAVGDPAPCSHYRVIRIDKPQTTQARGPGRLNRPATHVRQVGNGSVLHWCATHHRVRRT